MYSTVRVECTDTKNAYNTGKQSKWKLIGWVTLLRFVRPKLCEYSLKKTSWIVVVFFPSLVLAQFRHHDSSRHGTSTNSVPFNSHFRGFSPCFASPKTGAGGLNYTDTVNVSVNLAYYDIESRKRLGWSGYCTQRN